MALELNISISTVSRAIANNPVVKPETRLAVQKLAEKYNYTPNLTALSLRSNKTRTIGIIIPQLVHEFFATVIRGIEDFAYANGYSVIICSSHNSYEREVIDSKTLINGRVDGLLACITKDTSNFDHFKEFVTRKIPLVFFDCICDEIDSPRVIIDDCDAGYKATKHLVDQGCKRIAYLGSSPSLITNKERLNGYKKALAESNLPFKNDWILHTAGGDDFEEGQALSENLINKKEIDGLFASTDMLGISAMKKIKQAGLKIPEDVAVIGFSNWVISSIYEPAMSTISQPGYEMGFKAAELLIEQVNNKGQKFNKTHILNTEVVARESTKRI
ncbi:MAG: LacI family transcriptional regulator [Cyclobacteriaceae bacterium]